MAFFRILYFLNPKTLKRFPLTQNHSSFISIIIPCRNEENRLPFLLDSLSQQTYKNFEIIIVDDHSQDKTVDIAKTYHARIIPLDQVSPSWQGKSAACYAGALSAKGDILLFLDADGVLSPSALDYLLEHFSPHAVLSSQPYHTTKHWFEDFSLYPNLITILGLEAGHFKNPFQTTRGFFGPCMMVSKQVYFAVDGHLTVKDSILEDMDLGKQFSQAGYPVLLLPHNYQITFRMYPEGILTLFRGWMKNMALGAIRSNILTILLITGLITTSFSIPISLIKAFLARNWFLTTLYTTFYFLYAFLLSLSAKRVGSFRWQSYVLFPLFSFFFVIVFVSSLFAKLFHIPIFWRGRNIKP